MALVSTFVIALTFYTLVLLGAVGVDGTADTHARLWDWLRTNGCKIQGVYLDYFGPTHIRGLALEPDIDHVQIKLHQDVVWTTEVAFKDVQLRHLLQINPARESIEVDSEDRVMSVSAGNCSEFCFRFSPQLMLVAHVAVEKRKKEASFWKPYIDTFPNIPKRAAYIIAAAHSCDVSLLSSSENIQKSFARSRYATRVLEQEVSLLTKQTTILAQLFKRSSQIMDDEFRCTLLWAGAVRATRGFSFPILEENLVSEYESIALIPVFDMLNHVTTQGAPNLTDIIEVMSGDGTVSLKNLPTWNENVGLATINTVACNLGGTFITDEYLDFFSNEDNMDQYKQFNIFGCAEIVIGGEAFEFNTSVTLPQMLSIVAQHTTVVHKSKNSQVVLVDLLRHLITARVRELPPLSDLVAEVLSYRLERERERGSPASNDENRDDGVIDVKYQNVVGSVTLALEHLTLRHLLLLCDYLRTSENDISVQINQTETTGTSNLG